MRSSVVQGVIAVAVVAGLVWVLVGSADGWADWVVFGAIVATAFGAAIAVEPRLHARRRRTISRSSAEPPARGPRP